MKFNANDSPAYVVDSNGARELTVSHDTQVKQDDRKLADDVTYLFQDVLGHAARGDLNNRIIDLLATVRREEQANFVNNVAAILDADDVEAFTALIMKAKASPDLNSETRSALRSEAEIRREAFKEAVALVQSVTNENDLDDGGFFEAGFIAARTKSIDALIEASATEKGEVNG